MPHAKEDVPGVPTDAWCRVTRGVPPLDPFTPGGCGTCGVYRLWTCSHQQVG